MRWHLVNLAPTIRITTLDNLIAQILCHITMIYTYNLYTLMWLSVQWSPSWILGTHHTKWNLDDVIVFCKGPWRRAMPFGRSRCVAWPWWSRSIGPSPHFCHVKTCWSNSILPNNTHDKPTSPLRPSQTPTLWVSARVKLSRPISMAFRAASPSWATGLRREDMSWANYHSDGDITKTLLTLQKRICLGSGAMMMRSTEVAGLQAAV